LTGRIQKIRIGDAASKDISVTSGVPQGSHLGTLCFIWFINKISVIFECFRVLFYADERNSLFLNVDKCKTITFTKTRIFVGFAYMLIGTVLDRVSSINDLEVIMDEKIDLSHNWKRQYFISIISKKQHLDTQ
jgi:hypothetical protein